MAISEDSETRRAILVEKLRSRIPLFATSSLTIQQLSGGITNENYLVETEAGRFVLRVAGKGTEELGINRHHEFAAATLAWELDIGPEIVAYWEQEGIFVSRYVEGRSLTAEDFRSPAVLQAAATLLRTLHGARAIPGEFSAFRTVERYAYVAERHGVPLPHDLEDSLAFARRIEGAVGLLPPVPCHNDLLAANFLSEGDRLYLLDWEYAGMGDPYFDLGNLAANQAMDEGQEAELVRAYFGGLERWRLARLRLMRVMSDFREAMWGFVQSAVSALDFDFLDYARQHYDRLRTALMAPSLRRELEQVLLRPGRAY